jgi:hypothetical protein
MPGRQAKILSSADINDLLVFASCTRNPLRNRVIVLLSAKAGLRASEIGNLIWDMVVDANGQIGGLIGVFPMCNPEGSRDYPDCCGVSAWCTLPQCGREARSPRNHHHRFETLFTILWLFQISKKLGAGIACQINVFRISLNSRPGSKKCREKAEKYNLRIHVSAPRLHYRRFEHRYAVF